LGKICKAIVILLATVAFVSACSNTHEYTGEETVVQVEITQIWCIDDLGQIIINAGAFWEDWWHVRGRFSYYHMGYWLNVDGESMPMYSNLYVELMPSSGFHNINDIKNYLSQYYTGVWIDANLPGGFSPTAPFAEYNNTLYSHEVRISSVYMNWETATHTLVEQNASHVVIETFVMWHDQETSDIFVVQIYFTFVDGRIDAMSICPIWRGPI